MISLRLFLWVAPHVVVAFCLIGFLRRAQHKRFPLFFSYLILEEVSFSFFFGLIRLPPLLKLKVANILAIYQSVDLVYIAIDSCLQIAIVYEVADQLISPLSSISSTFRPLMRWAAGVLVILAVGVAAAFSGLGLKRFDHAFEILNFCAYLVNIGLLLVLLLFTRALHISWKSLPAGIALGFGVVSSAEVGATSLISALGHHGMVPADIVRTGAFLGCTIVWLIYILLPEAKPRVSGQGLQQSEIELWDQSLREIVKR